MNLVRCDDNFIYIVAGSGGEQAVFSLKDAERVMSELPAAVANLKTILKERAARDYVEARKRFVEMGGNPS